MSFGDYDEIKKMMELLEKSSLRKLRIKNGEKEISLEKDSAHAPVQPIAQPIAAPKPIDASEKSTPKAEESSDSSYITSPVVGTFYTAPSPDQPNFIKVGDTVDADTCVCIIEAMKVMNEVKAGVKGVVEEILIDDNHPVEFGTKLIKIKKA